MSHIEFEEIKDLPEIHTTRDVYDFALVALIIISVIQLIRNLRS